MRHQHNGEYCIHEAIIKFSEKIITQPVCRALIYVHPAPHSTHSVVSIPTNHLRHRVLGKGYIIIEAENDYYI